MSAMGERVFGIIVGWITPTQPIVRYINAPDHIACVRAILEIEAQCPWDVAKQQYRKKELKWEVIEDATSSD